MTIAEQLIRAKTDLDNVYNAGYEAGKAEGGGEPSEVTDLTGTVWKLNSTVSVADVFEYEIDFISNGKNFNNFIIYKGSGMNVAKELQYGATGETPITAYRATFGKPTWIHYNYRIIEISGGVDAQSATLIPYLYANGELLSKGSYDDGFANGQISVLGEFADWNLSTTSNSCMVSITNTHTSLYLHLEFYVFDAANDVQEYSASVVVPPDSSYSWDSGDWYDSLSGAEWYINITGMRFSKDGV